jgi:CRP-like cAMP-binding protein
MSSGRIRHWLACCLGRGDLAPLGPYEVDELAESHGEDSYAGGTFVFREGDESARVHVVRSGRLELSRSLGERRVTLQVLRPGDVFGDVPVLLGQPEPFDARAMEDSVVLSFDVDSLYELLRTRPRMAERWLVSLAERTYGFQQRLNDLLSGSLEGQLASLLLREADDGEVDLTQQAIADLLGTQRSSVNRVLKNLETAGVIELRYGKIVVIDPGALDALSPVGQFPSN